MIVRARTRSGTVYRFDSEAMTWEKESITKESGHTRSSSGKLVCFPLIEQGETIHIYNNPQEMMDSRFIITSPVVEILPSEIDPTRLANCGAYQ